MTTNTEQKTQLLPEAGNLGTGAADETATVQAGEKACPEGIDAIVNLLREQETILVKEWLALLETVLENVKQISAQKPVAESKEQTVSTETQSPESAATNPTENVGGARGLFEACRTKLQEVDAKKVAAPIVEAAGKTVVVSLGVGFALTALCIRAVVDAAKEGTQSDGTQSSGEAPAPSVAGASADTDTTVNTGAKAE